MFLIHHECMIKFTKIELFTRKISPMQKKMDNFTIDISVRNKISGKILTSKYLIENVEKMK